MFPDQKAAAQAVGDILARASWLYECTHIPNVPPLRAVACLEQCLDGIDPAIGHVIASMWNRCPSDMPSRERFRILLEGCHERGWHSNEGLAS